MPRRTIEADGQVWDVSPTGRVTQYARDEFGVMFRRRGGGAGDVRVSRFSPLGARNPEDALAELAQPRLQELFQRSQPSWTAPETGYVR
jgi:hypothetical protein